VNIVVIGKDSNGRVVMLADSKPPMVRSTQGTWSIVSDITPRDLMEDFVRVKDKEERKLLHDEAVEALRKINMNTH
jgi:hypothetical protein